MVVIFADWQIAADQPGPKEATTLADLFVLTLAKFDDNEPKILDFAGISATVSELAQAI
jgi:hypothetical protein